ncbi:MAG: trimethylamine methyltransferase family protein, partial [Dehalococcoidales bacterium]|nr:trimethylamine methyltransferase family protein [Dehalococcoidales bacterium]
MPREGILVHNPYERMTGEQIQQIHQASMQILHDPGLISFNREAAEIFHSNGAEVTIVSSGDSPCWLVKIPEKLVLHAL